MQSRSPTFLILGAQKAGTTSVYHYLRQHPQVFMCPRKEPHFFAYEGESVDDAAGIVTDWQAYRGLFRDAGDASAIGEASPSYLYVPRAAQRIAHRLPEARLIAIVRNPIERAFSNYQHCVRTGHEPLGFGAALDAENGRMAAGWGARWHYVHKGLYRQQLDRFLERFDRQQLHVALYDDLVADPAGFMREIFGFLGIDAGLEVEVGKRYNVSGVPRNRLLARLWARTVRVRPVVVRALPAPVVDIGRRMLQAKPRLEPELRQRLAERFRDDVARLSELLDHDLSHWLSGSGERGR